MKLTNSHNLLRAGLTLLVLLAASVLWAQGGNEYFHQGSGQFIRKNMDEALASVNKGLRAEPSNKKLQQLKKLLEQQKKEQQQQEKQQKQQEQQQKQDQQKKDQEQKEQEKKEQEKQEQEKKEKEQEKKDPEKKEQEPKDEKPEDKPEDKKETPPDLSEKLKQLQMDEQKARMILEAMKNQEIQYLQQNKRKATKPKDKNKPDW
ncbi:MAG: hypothetical protein MUC38_15400 [Cyclobacteriaceae bacterium]|jgi:Ca-activated chloride channel family protein|nr:hypothetical protein [Cyclobacteriaceae bacterium]